MEQVTIRDLRNHGGELVDRVQAGQPLTVTRSGKPVAELRPILRKSVSAAQLLTRWSKLPTIAPTSFRADIDLLLDSAL
jgi:prevent-host-death family protein